MGEQRPKALDVSVSEQVWTQAASSPHTRVMKHMVMYEYIIIHKDIYGNAGNVYNSPVQVSKKQNTRAGCDRTE